jgi:glycosyltransferase involved in cell wall biosynthesis
MKGLVDIYKIKSLNNGLGQFSYHLYLNLLEKKKKNFELDFLIPNHPIGVPLKSIPSVGYIKSNVQRRFFPGLNQTYDFWHCLQQFPSFLPNRRTPMILTIHDLNFLVEKEESKALSYLKKLQENVDRASYITTISNFTRSEVEKYLDLKGKEVHVIFNGVTLDAIEARKPEYVTMPKFFFSIGEFKVKKNFQVLVPLMKYFDDHQLIMAGYHDTIYGQSIIEEIKRLGLGHRIILPGKIRESEKRWLYDHCRAFLFPSMAEGFGMPAIEAMLAGKPTFLSKYSSLPEIGGDKAMYFDSFDPENMARFITFQLDQFDLAQVVRAEELKKYGQKFNWSKCANEYLNIYYKVTGIQK